MNKILVVDDDQNILNVINLRLEANNYCVATTLQAEAAVKMAKNKNFDLAVVDFKLVGKNGIELMGELHQIDPELPIIILTAYGTIADAVQAMKKGAYSYLEKPFNDQELLLQIKKGLEKRELSNEVKRLRDIIKGMNGLENIVGESKKMKEVMGQVIQAAKTDSNIYIYGESGTGKELIAKKLHVASSRKNFPFLAINCAAIPETLLESELFGSEAGAFTGATRRKGVFALAHKGTLFLDEISEMPLTMQAKLLRVLEAKEFRPLGSEKIVKIDTRIIVASNKNLEEVVKKGTFREDLFYRIHVIPIKLPPLREKKEDILLLAEFFMQKYTDKMKKNMNGFSASASQKLMLYHWPGNVRELENTIERAVAMSVKDVITEDMILPTRESENKGLQPLKSAKADFEKDYLVQLIRLTHGNVTQAAKLAGKYRADLYELLKKHDLKPIDFKAGRGNADHLKC
ncbi:MAG: sigma-54 dependent transcriptional regulator [Candidatus Scalindua rubra]|uniref:Sigma 54 response regulator n=1 Tax=Candidatus Scalindua brodae TaxID=237368 RepID=A0A0B0EM60_9BACT|nr:MAG: sigma 54 response regulator [Candidatus Scalindua brodae]MBZ0107503.1 sigma-54 dependent transcriptional regulator [Candidatus Scalindua rubra]